MKHIFNLVAILCLVLTSVHAGNYVIINQVMYDSPWNEKVTTRPYSHGEFIELYNAGTSNVNLEGWTLMGEGSTEKLIMPSGVNIPAQGYLVIAYRYSQAPEYQLSDLFALPTDSNSQIYYQSKIVLSNSGESIILKDATGMVVDSLYYHGTSNKSNPARLHAENADSIMGCECVSLHRTDVEFDIYGNTLPESSKWETCHVTFSTHQLPHSSYGEKSLTNNQPLPNNKNYIISIAPLDATNRISCTNGNLSVSSNVRTNTAIVYYDGLGRPYETIALAQSPNKSDLISMTSYTGLKRNTHQWLPIIEDNSGQPVTPTDFEEKSRAFYRDNHPYHETRYENSVLNRVTGATRPGDSYANHPSTQTYEINTTADNVRMFSVEYTNNEDTKLKCESNGYRSCTLYKTTMADEDGKTITTFTDQLGRIVLERHNNNDTYYVYDHKGQLCYVLPPLVANQIGVGIHSDTIDILKKYAYVYRYDERGNQIYKRLPGATPTLMVYDITNTLVMSQTGTQRERGSYWTVYKYDELRRLLYTAEVNTGNNSHQDYLNSFREWYMVESFSTSSQPHPMSNTGYSRGFFHTHPMTLLTVNYYDNYDFLHFVSNDNRMHMAFDAFEGNNEYGNTTGLLTGTRTYYLDGSGDYSETVYYYDYRGREIQRKSTNHLGGHDALSTKYDFSNNVVDTWAIQTTQNDSVVTEHYHYTYDHAGRPLTTSYTFNDETPIVLQSYNYDELGRVHSRYLHNAIDSIVFNYDLRNQITQIKSAGYKQNYYYDKPCPLYNGNAEVLYNGNINATTWTYGNSVNGYLYLYDYMNRLTLTYCFYDGELSGRKYSESFNYDAHGNITELTRWGPHSVLNELVLNYDGNQLICVDDSQSGSHDYITKQYHDNNTIGNDFAYDANGNMTYDKDRSIAAICYNLLNLPDTIQFTNGNQIIHRYDAAGNRLATDYYTRKVNVTVPLGDVFSATDSLCNYYVTRDAFHNNIVYNVDTNDVYGIKFVHNPEGYIRYYDNMSEHYHHYYIKDHLGNIRETYKVWPKGAKLCTQRMQYYPSGLPWAATTNPSEQPYLYNSKEFVEMYGLDEYDSEARWYYPAICRTTTMDPLAEKYYSTSPYAWCGNNPVRFVDPDGMDWYMDEDSTIVWTDYGSQQEMDDNDVQGTYLGEAYVEINGSYDEQLGEGNNLFGEGAILATAIVYGPKGANDIAEYAAFTMSSDYEEYGAIEDGVYVVYYKESTGPMGSHWSIENGDPILCINNDNKAYSKHPETYPYSKEKKNALWIHRSNNNGDMLPVEKGTGKVKPLSTGCIIIAPSYNGRRGWNQYNSQLQGIKKYPRRLKRR